MFRQQLCATRWAYLAVLPVLLVLAAAPAGAADAEKRATPTPGGRRARITLNVPLDAIVWIDGRRTDPTGTTRQFITPPLPSGQRYFYDLKVTWIDGSRAREIRRRLSFRAGDQLSLNFSRPNWRETAQDLYVDPAAPDPWGYDYYQDPINAPNQPNNLYIRPGVRPMRP